MVFVTSRFVDDVAETAGAASGDTDTGFVVVVGAAADTAG
jgi:hypothetical protein